MVFVTVGSAPQGFRRLLEAVDRLAGLGAFGQLPVFMQIGHTTGFTPGHCEYRAFVSREAFQQLVKQADLVICHGGATPLEIIRAGKTAIVMPRRKQFGEIVNDHQVEFVEVLAAHGWVIPAMQPEDLPEAIAKAKQIGGRIRSVPSSPMVALVSKALEDLSGRPGASRQDAA